MPWKSTKSQRNQRVKCQLPAATFLHKKIHIEKFEDTKRVRPRKKIHVFPLTYSKILGSVGRIFFLLF